MTVAGSCREEAAVEELAFYSDNRGRQLGVVERSLLWRAERY